MCVYYLKVSIIISFVFEFKFIVLFLFVVYRGFLVIIIGFVGGILVVFLNIEVVLFMVINLLYEGYLCLW